MAKLSSNVSLWFAACVYLISQASNVNAQFQQQSYYFTTSSCTPGSTIGTIYANGATGYSISSSNGQFAVSTNGMITPQMNLVSGTYTIYVTSYGSMAATVPVQIVANCYINGNAVSTGSSFAQQSYYFTTSSCTPGTAIGTVYANGATGYSIGSSNGQFAVSTTGMITPQTNLASGTYTIYVTSYGGVTATVPVQIVATCYGNGNTGSAGGSFTQQSYTFTTSSCTPGTSIGTVYANGATGYSIGSSNGQFAVSTTGMITPQTNLASGTYTIYVTSYGGVTATVPVQIVATCYGNNGNNVINGIPIGTVGSFSQQSYTFTVTSCYSGSTIGSVYASGATGYTATSTNGVTSPFTVSPTGAITSTGQLTNGVYSLQVTAFGSVSASVPVTITVQCNSNGISNNFGNNNGNNFGGNWNKPPRRHDDHWGRW